MNYLVSLYKDDRTQRIEGMAGVYRKYRLVNELWVTADTAFDAAIKAGARNFDAASVQGNPREHASVFKKIDGTL